MKGMPSLSPISCLLAALICMAAMPGFCRAGESSATVWRGGSGNWADHAKWSAGIPDLFREATIGGLSRIVIAGGEHAAADLRVGTASGDRTEVKVDGGHLLVRQDSLIVGEYSGGEARLIVNDGSVDSAMDIFVGGATGGTGRMNTSALIVRGGRLTGLTLTAGAGLGAETVVEVDGSRAAAISILEFFQLMAFADPGGKAGQATLAFTLDAHGVTPIAIRSRWEGLRIMHDSASRCQLRIGLSAVPPRDDVTLVSSRAATEGTFDNLPEGSEITAEFGGRTYRWRLTYRGGASGHDLVLQNHSEYAADAPRTHILAQAAVVDPRWWGHPVYPLALAPGAAAFPGAEGYGASTAGGRDGRTVYVDNLNDAGAGSLRAAVDAAGARIIAFRVAGSIVLQSPLVVSNPHLTLDGATAPGAGIMLRRHGIVVRTHDVILRHFRIRIGDDDVHRGDATVRYEAGDGIYALSFEGARNAIADHLSLSWSTNKILSTTKLSDRITIQWCILSESLNIGGHGFASIAGGSRVTWHHNLFAHNQSRNVRFQGAVDADFRNNVIYDWGGTAAYGEFDRLNYVANFLKPGPSTTQNPQLFHRGTEVVAPASLFLTDNILEGSEKATRDNWKGSAFYYDRARVMAAQPFPAPHVSTDTATAAFQRVLADAGATLPRRDAVDQRIVRETADGTGRIIESVEDVGGWSGF